MEGARYRANCLPEPREPFKRDTVDLVPGAIAGAGGVCLPLTFSTPRVGFVILMIFPKQKR